MKIVFMGTPDFAAATLKELLNSSHEVAAVVTQPDKPKGRSKQLQPSPVKELAVSKEIPVLQPVKLREEGVLEQIAAFQPEVIVVAAFGQIVPKSILELPKRGCLNVHASLLPKYRGAAPIQWALLNGDELTGVTIMQMNEGLDTGDMLAIREIPILKNDTAGTLFDKLAEEGAKLLVEVLDNMDRGVIYERIKQPAESPTPYARMINKADGNIDWSKPAEEIERLVRGMDPWPAAFSYLNNKMVKISKSELCPISQEGILPGQIIGTEERGLCVATGKDALLIKELQLEGKKKMSWMDFSRGTSWKCGMCFQREKQ